jgi:hypothetical protein
MLGKHSAIAVWLPKWQQARPLYRIAPESPMIGGSPSSRRVAHDESGRVYGVTGITTRSNFGQRTGAVLSQPPSTRFGDFHQPTFNGRLQTAAHYVMPHGQLIPIPRDYRS